MTTPNLSDESTICPLATPTLTLADAGGKGANLSVMLRAGLPVPDGFVVTTAGYRAFVAANNLTPLIDAQWQLLAPGEPASFETAAAAARAAFAAAPMTSRRS